MDLFNPQRQLSEVHQKNVSRRLDDVNQLHKGITNMATTTLKQRRISQKVVSGPPEMGSTPTGIVIEPMTIVQFRSYLKGITFVGGQNWHPSRDQWEAIVQIVDQLIVPDGAATSIPRTTGYQPSPGQRSIAPTVQWNGPHQTSHEPLPPQQTFNDNFTTGPSSVSPMQTDPDDYNSPFI